jgi:MoaA/NifB/PqqE/SkfB family radical SAM enzyme
MSEPVHIMFEVTQRCNNNCIYCYNVWKADINYPAGELSLPEIKTLWDRLTDDIIVQSVTLTGGEPLMRRDIEDIASYLLSKRIKLSLATNGTLVDENRAKSLVNAGLKSFEIPLLSTDRDIHNSLSRNNAYDKSCEAITNLKAHEAGVTAVFVATRLNIGHFNDVAELAFALGADAIMIDRFLLGGEGKNNQEELAPTNKELAELVEKAEKAAIKYKLEISLGIPMPRGLVDSSRFKKVKFGECGAGRGKWAIDPLGNLRLCEQEPSISGNLLTHDFIALKNKTISHPPCYTLLIPHS